MQQLASAPGSHQAIVDPAGLAYIQSSPGGAGGASGQLYQWLGITNDPSFPEPVKAGITGSLKAKFHSYGDTKHVIHAVGPNSQSSKCSWEDGLAELAQAYSVLLAVDGGLAADWLAAAVSEAQERGAFDERLVQALPTLLLLARLATTSAASAPHVQVVALAADAAPAGCKCVGSFACGPSVACPDDGLSVLGLVLDYLALCQYGDRFMVDLRSPQQRLESGVSAVERSAGLVGSLGQRARMLSYHLGMHAWVRTLRVPGRGAPIFILHDEYLSWASMLRTLVDSMTRNGGPRLIMAEIGIPSQDWASPALLREFTSMQYMGVMLEEDDRVPGQDPTQRYALYAQMRAQLPGLGSTSVLHFASSQSAADAMKGRFLDIAVVDASGSREKVLQDLQIWESRVKPGGILAGRGFEPGSMEGVRSVCEHRFGNDFHLGMGGGFWWLVEPEEE
ncbi:unnamed protein product [Polarella glacialis]|uniref:Macro domain-containing protein n=1 Tax=Polarella glacialis TaxID=89957 RepID=A0A813JSW9_POLGL|nr:unnamed protein product [Polarella glacialis]